MVRAQARSVGREAAARGVARRAEQLQPKTQGTRGRSPRSDEASSTAPDQVGGPGEQTGGWG